MKAGMGRLTEVWKSRLLAGVAACTVGCALGLGSTAWAQMNDADQTTTIPAPAPKPSRDIGMIQRATGRDHASPDQIAPAAKPTPLASVTADQLMSNQAFYMEADTVIRDDAGHNWTAKGSVEARYQGRTLRADEVDYNTDNGVIKAKGDVQLINADGTVEFAKAMTMDKDFKAGIALAFSTRQRLNAKIIADEAVRLNKDAMELNKAVFTVCDICAPDGSPQSPTWSIQAAQVIQDHKRQIVYYKHVVIRVKGIPILASPVFWHADPAANRASGLLAPKIAYDRRGLSYEQPYLWVISPSQDLVIAPEINTRVNPIVEGEYRERFYSGELEARFGYTDEQQFDGHGNKYDNLTSRSYILGQGAFAPTPDWTLGFSAERVTDPLMFSRYDVPNVYDARGLFSTDDQRLITQGYAVEQNQTSYVSIATMSFQGLRPTDQNGVFPLVAPLVEAHFEPDFKILDGRLRLDASGVLLQRDRPAYAVDTPLGADSRRGSFGGDWQSSFTFANGLRVEPFGNARQDIYNARDITESINTNNITYAGTYTTARTLATAGVDLSWPFFRRQGDTTVVLEPLAQIAVSPSTKANPLIPNEDSQVFQFDETNLFEANKSPGFDYYEGGARINVGGRATVSWDEGGSAQLLIGRSYRTRPDSSLPASTSLNQVASDWVVAASFQPDPAFSSYSRARLDSDTGRINTLEVGLNGSSTRANGFLRYLYDAVDTPGTKMENVQVGGQVLISKHWGVTSSANYDIAAHVPVLEEAGLLYQDECTHWELVYQHDGTYDRTLHPSDKIIIRLLLATLGGTGYQRPDFR
jgi:LPS-assembly protein